MRDGRDDRDRWAAVRPHGVEPVRVRLHHEAAASAHATETQSRRKDDRGSFRRNTIRGTVDAVPAART